MAMTIAFSVAGNAWFWHIVSSRPVNEVPALDLNPERGKSSLTQKLYLL